VIYNLTFLFSIVLFTFAITGQIYISYKWGDT